MSLHTFSLGCAVRQLDWPDFEASDHLAHFRMIVDAEHKIRADSGKIIGQFLKVTDFKIVIVIWRLIVRRVKKKQGAGLVVGLEG
jgi:hypothetical protein